MAIRNFCVARGTMPAEMGGNLYRVPPEHSFILKSIIIRPRAAGTWYLTLNLESSSAAVTLIRVQGAAAADINWNFWAVLNADDVVALSVNLIGADYWVGGAVLPYAPATPPVVAWEGPQDTYRLTAQ